MGDPGLGEVSDFVVNKMLSENNWYISEVRRLRLATEKILVNFKPWEKVH
jgi:hypothetical protein